MRALIIRLFMPFLLCLVPFIGAALVLLCIPDTALKYFYDHFGKMEGLIVGGGILLFLVQMVLTLKALIWRGTRFDDGTDRWLTNLGQAAEWFPMLGLIGTVAGILEAFASSSAGSTIEPRVIAPAITATGSGLFMALINMFPVWIVLLGRDLILTLSGTQLPPPSAREE